MQNQDQSNSSNPFADPTQELNAVSIKFPPFWPEKPEIWFYQIEAQFEINRITTENTRFNYLVAQLEPKYLENIWDIIKSQDKNKYTSAKNRLLHIFKESSEAKIKKLLTGMQLGDCKPSQLLRKMQALSETDDISEKVLKTLWMDKLPESIKNVIIVSDENLEKLSVMADKILEMNPRSEIFASTSQNPNFNNEMIKKIESLEKEIASLRAITSRTRSRSRSRSRSSSRNWGKFNPKGKYCYFHFKFGTKCKPDKCKPPCEWKQSVNSQQQ